MIKYIIVDDEPLAREGIQINCDKVSDLQLEGSFENAILANDFLRKQSVDLMFLDIQMPGLTGLEFLRALKNPPQVILTTAYTQYALESYELDVVDYLVKPIRFERFLKAVNKVKEIHELQNVTPSSIDDYNDTFMYIKSDRQFVKVYYDEIHYIQGMKDYVLIHADNNKYMTALNVKTIMSKLPKQQFARVSKSYIVQIKNISSVGTDTIFTGQHELPLGPSYKEAFVNDFIKTNLVSR